jgi:hypothetical protein
MKKNICHLLLFLFSISLVQRAFGQPEKFDITTYRPPQGWQKTSRQSFVSFITANQSTGGFCLIALYSAIPGSGNTEQDFAKEWDELVVKPYGAEKNPKTETQSNPEGWKVTAGAATVQKDNISSYILLSVFTGFNKTISVLANLNDQAYIPEIDKFIENMNPDKNASIANRVNPEMKNDISINNAQPGKFGQMLYTVPSGWKLTNYQNAVSISPPDLPQGEVLNIYILPASDFTGNLQQALEKSYDETCTLLQVTKMNEVSGKNYSAREAKKSFRGWEYIRCSGGIKVNNGTPYPAEYGLELFVIRINNRYERVAIVKSRNTCGGLSRYYPSDRLIYTEAIENFLFSLKFDDWKEPVVKKGIVSDNGAGGVWQGLSMSVGLAKPGAGLGAELTTKNLILFSNGQAYFGKYFPAQGLDGLDTWIKAENNRRDWGFYSFANGKGLLKMPYGDIPLRLENKKLIVTTNNTNHAFIRQSDVSFAKFSGNYVMSEWNGTIPSISFTTDGKFADKGAIRVLCHEYVDCLNPALNPGSGSYEVKNHSLIFRYSDGRIIKVAFNESGFAKNNADPSSILTVGFNNDVLQRQ